MRKKVLSLALALVMCLGLTVPAFAVESEFDIYQSYLLRYNGPGGDVTIPDGVTEIGWGVNKPFKDNKSLTSVTIPDSVTVIGEGAFQGCTGLTSVTIPDSVTYIGPGAFRDCTGLTSVTIGGLTRGGDNAFAGCTGLTSVTISDGVTLIGIMMFSGCTSLASVTIPDSVTSIWDISFSGCTGLSDIYYGGTEAQWKAINIPNMADLDLPSLPTSATVHYNSAGPQKPIEPTKPSFTDVKTGDYFADPVLWAVEKKITAGTSATTFSPNATCTQSQILSFLWRAKGEPKPTGTVSGTQYYATAAQWAKEQGLTDNFSAEADCTRAMVVTYLWKLAGSPNAGTSDFTDVPANADYAQAVAWAVEQGITSGTGNGQFSPNSICSRGQIVTFLYRAFAK